VSRKASPFIWVGASNTYNRDFPKLYILTYCVGLKEGYLGWMGRQSREPVSELV